MKLPNGYGSVYKLSGNRRNPWIARKTTGWQEMDNGKRKQQYLTIGYFHTKNEAMKALKAYNENPIEFEKNGITFKEIYAMWARTHYENIVPGAQRSLIQAYEHSAPLYDLKMREIDSAILLWVILQASADIPTKQRMQDLYNMMYQYALKESLIDNDCKAFIPVE